MNTLEKLYDDLPFPCEIHCARFDSNIFNKFKNLDRYKVFINSTEPNSSCQPIQDVINKHKYFDLILTKTPEIINNCDNSKLFLFGDTWVKPNNSIDVKKFSVSFLCSAHVNRCLNYEIRKELWHRQNEIKIPKNFFSSNITIIDENRKLPFNSNKFEEKLPIFESMFSVSFENSVEINYFSEKIIDCFHCKTIPIYCGCPNISDYFNMDGVIKVNSVDELISTCNTLTPELYVSKHEAIMDNYNRAFSYFPITERIHEEIISNYKIKYLKT